MTARKNKPYYNKRSWQLMAIGGPVVWLLMLREYMKTGCITNTDAGILCGDHAIIGLLLLFIFLMALPVIYFVKVRHDNDADGRKQSSVYQISRR